MHDPSDPTEAFAAGGPYGIIASGLALIAICVGLFLVWQTISSLLIVFAGILLAAFRGIALAMPLVAIARVAIIRFYVEDYLGDDLEPATMREDASAG